MGPVGWEWGDWLSEVDSADFETNYEAAGSGEIFFNDDAGSSDGEDGYLSNGELDIPWNPDHMDFDTPEQKAEYHKKYDKYHRRRCRDGNQAPPDRLARAQGDDEVNEGQEPAGREQAPIRMPRKPAKPTAEEIAAHKCTHFPHRDWCEVCAQAIAREDKHFRNKDIS